MTFHETIFQNARVSESKLVLSERGGIARGWAGLTCRTLDRSSPVEPLGGRGTLMAASRRLHGPGNDPGSDTGRPCHLTECGNVSLPPIITAAPTTYLKGPASKGLTAPQLGGKRHCRLPTAHFWRL